MEKIEIYKLASSICKTVYEKIKNNVKNTRQVSELINMGEMYLKEEFDKIERDCKIVFPVCISLNNTIGYSRRKCDIKDGDIVKIEFGVSVDGCINILGETFVVNNESYENVIKMLNKLKKDKELLKLCVPGESNDSIRMYIESKCTDYNVFPIENCVSNQHVDSQLRRDDAKYIVLNYIKYYDENDNLLSGDNFCYELEDGDVFTLNITVVGESNVYKYIEDGSDVYKFNEYKDSLKLSASRQFLNKYKKKNEENAFCINNETTGGFKCGTGILKTRIAIKECIEKGILDEYCITRITDENKCIIPVFFKKFTIIITKGIGVAV